MDEITNADRAEWALAALSNFVAATKVDTARDAIADLIANLLHLARGRGLEVDLLLDQTRKLMTEEFAEDPEGDMAIVQERFRELLPYDG
ncbi:hypothetical protein LC612_34210 [Nostoc sp. CHAB 5834]|nr:hypothetical protein [Nostoc sp. CHAB 5834]